MTPPRWLPIRWCAISRLSAATWLTPIRRTTTRRRCWRCAHRSWHADRKGERVIPIDDFFVDAFTTCLDPEEILTEIRVPKPAANSGAAYVKFERKVGDYAIAATAAYLEFGANGKIANAGIGLTNASYKPLRGR